MTRATWRILDYGGVPETSPSVIFDCPRCGRAAALPVLGLAVAQLRDGLVFDLGPHAMPTTIQCRQCRRIFRGGETMRRDERI